MVVASAAGVIPTGADHQRVLAQSPVRHWNGNATAPAIDTLSIHAGKPANAKLDSHLADLASVVTFQRGLGLAPSTSGAALPADLASLEAAGVLHTDGHGRVQVYVHYQGNADT